MMVITATATKATTAAKDTAAMNEEQRARSIARDDVHKILAKYILNIQFSAQIILQSSEEINRMESTPVIHALQNQNLQLFFSTIGRASE